MSVEPKSLQGIASRQGGFLTLSQAAATGLTDAKIRTLVRHGQLDYVTNGVRRLHEIGLARPCEPWRDRVRTELLLAGDGAVASGHTAARLLGIVGAPAVERIWLAVPRERHPEKRPGIKVVRTIVPAHEVIDIDGIPATTALRTLLDCARYGDPLAAACLIESALRQELVAAADLREAVGVIQGQRGSVRASKALLRVDVRSESPLETKARLLLVDAGLPYPQLQTPFALGDSRRVDLSYAAPAGSAYVGLAIEIDGRSVHALEAAFDLDPVRHVALEELRWLVRRFTARHLEDEHYFVTTVRRALDRLDPAPN